MPRSPGRGTTRIIRSAAELEIAWYASPWESRVFAQPCCVAEHPAGTPIGVGAPANATADGQDQPARVGPKAGDPWSRDAASGTIGWSCPRCADLIAGL